jgi:hypothetical protein
MLRFHLCAVCLLALSLSAIAKDNPFAERQVTITPSPVSACELKLDAGQRVIDFDVWSSGGEAVALVRDADGTSKLLGWKLGASAAEVLAVLPANFEAHALALHPAERRIFVSGRVGQQWQILAFEPKGSVWHSHPVYSSQYPIRRLLVGPRPFSIGWDKKSATDIVRYRLFFGVKLGDGIFGIRSVTEEGKREYQVIGPKIGLPPPIPDSDQPQEITVASALPAAFHPAGNILLWQDQKGCFQQLPYAFEDWGKVAPIKETKCNGSLTFTPNGTALVDWSKGKPGVTIRLGTSKSEQATDYELLSTPSSTPDGKGLVGIVESADGRKLVYIPITVPLADVSNAWKFLDKGDALTRLERDSGVLHPFKADQLYELYDSELYGDCDADVSTGARPYLVTTDIFWELLGAAYDGTFIVEERQRAIPAFWRFAAAARDSLHAKNPKSPWTAAFDAVAAVHTGAAGGNAEAGRILRASERANSPVFGKEFNYAELTPRGHYTSSPELSAYFKAMHYLTQLGSVRDPAELASLPAGVKDKAMDWIHIYAGFIAPSRGALVWDPTAFTLPSYARHPAEQARIFPLSWGFDNEILLSAVYHRQWPPEEQIINGEMKRVIPSGLDLATVLGSDFARVLLKDELDKQPHLAPALAALKARAPQRSNADTLYDRWIEALGTQWAEDAKFPGAPDSALWKAKRLQTGLASWATLRHATVLVNERSDAEAGEGGFEELVTQPPRGYVEPDPATFAALADLFDDLAKTTANSPSFAQGKLEDPESDQSEPLRQGLLRRLKESAAKARLFQTIAQKELRGEALSDSDYEEILYVGRVAEHHFLVYKSLANKDLALSVPDPMPKVADVASDGAGNNGTGKLLEVAVGNPLEWDQIVPYFGRREIVKGAAYSYYEFTSNAPMTDEGWRKKVDSQARPVWLQPYVSGQGGSCLIKGLF